MLRCLILLATIAHATAILGTSRHHQKRSEAFSLAYIQHDYDDGIDQGAAEFGGRRKETDPAKRRDEVVDDAKCLAKCNSDLNIGMDMVNAHMAFGSIDVPSVIDKRDLALFCQLDSAHSKCIDECGYSVQFNLREYVCKNRYNEMEHYLKCYAHAAPILTKYCRPRCGAYTALKHNIIGYATRCRQLLCDHTCTEFLLTRVCGEHKGKRAAEFLLDFTRLQVEYWIREHARTHHAHMRDVYPASCRRLQCQGFSNEHAHCPTKWG